MLVSLWGSFVQYGKRLKIVLVRDLWMIANFLVWVDLVDEKRIAAFENKSVGALLSGKAVLCVSKITNCKINEKIIKRGVDSYRTVPAGAGWKMGGKLLMSALNRGDRIKK